MLVRLQNDLTPAQADSILLVAKGLGYACVFLDDARTLLELAGPGRPEHRSVMEDLTGVRAVLDAGDAHELHQRRVGQPDTRVLAGRARFGGPDLSLIAGPCAVESEEQAVEIARGVAARGATLLRGGAWKPRTSPYSFQGSHDAGLEWLAAARAETGLGIVTEVLDPRDVDKVSRVADVLQIGARNMANSPLLLEVGKSDRPVLLKRGFAATVREFVLAAEFVLSQGNEQVILCERGVRGFDNVTRNLLDVGAICHLKRATHLPVLADPSHAAGRADLVRGLARAGIAAGADGLIVEVHPRPDEARSDGGQAISLEEFSRIAEDTRILAGLDGRRVTSLDARRPPLVESNS